MTDFFAISTWIISIVRTYYTFKVVNSEDVTHNVILMGFWVQAELAFGIGISCFPVLPRLLKGYHSRIQAFPSRFPTGGMTGRGSSGSAFILAPGRRQTGKKCSDGFVDLQDSRPQDSRPKDDEKPSPFRGDSNDEPPGCILKTTHIEMELRPHANTTSGSYSDTETWQTRWWP